MDNEHSRSAQTALDRECRVFSRYLIGQFPSAYVLDKYRDAHAKLPGLRDGKAGHFDALLICLACRSPLLTRLADSYSRVLFKHSRVRTKLVVLLAILECCASSHRYFDRPEPCGKAMLFLMTLVHGLIFLGSFVLAVIMLAPARFLLERGFARFGTTR